MLKDKLILVDVDGVLLDWIHHFDLWMESHGHPLIDNNQYKVSLRYDITDVSYAKSMIARFNESANIGFLSPYRNAVKYVRKLHEEFGYVFHAITSQSSNPYAQKLRISNLEAIFGKDVFDQFTILGCGADKDNALAPYKNSKCYWVEDKPANADLGIELGLYTFLMSHPHNVDYSGNAIRVHCWQDIYNHIDANY